VGFNLEGLLLRLPVVLFALTVHEFMHGWVAHKCGDDTALHAGRLTLNPLPHLDLLGTLCLLFAPIGWAKPVPVNPSNFAYETRRRDEILVSGAGIAANFAMAIVVALVARVLVMAGAVPRTHLAAILWTMMGSAVLVNFGLGIFNLVPIAPLDGSHILKNLLPLNLAIRYAHLSRYGPILLMVFVAVNYVTGILAIPIVLLTLIFAGSDAWAYLFPQFVQTG
jgi:Zn-dependent protease